MKAHVVYMHTDLAHRLRELRILREQLEAGGVALTVVEGAGRGGLYAHLPNAAIHAHWWQCLHPNRTARDLAARRLAAHFSSALDRLSPDVVLTGPVAFSSGASAVPWGLKRGVPVVVMDTVKRRNVSNHPVVNLLKRCFYWNCDAVFLPAPPWKPDYEWWGVPADRQFYGYGCVDHNVWLEAYDAAMSEQARLRADWQLPARFFLGVGRWVPAKNWVRLLGAYRRYAAEARDPWELVLVGGGPDEAQIRRLAEAPEPGRILLRAFVPRTDIAGYYAFCSALVLPSVNEATGNVVSEAMWCASPVLVSRLCGSSEFLVRDGENGFLLDPFDVDSMARTLTTFADLPEERRRSMGVASRRIISEWGVDRFVEGIWQAIQFCLRTPKRRGPWWTRAVLPLWKGRYRPV